MRSFAPHCLMKCAVVLEGCELTGHKYGNSKSFFLRWYLPRPAERWLYTVGTIDLIPFTKSLHPPTAAMIVTPASMTYMEALKKDRVESIDTKPHPRDVESLGGPDYVEYPTQLTSCLTAVQQES